MPTARIVATGTTCLYSVFRIVGLCPAGKHLRICELKGSGLPVAIVPVIQVGRPN